jgi:hypothetical protein
MIAAATVTQPEIGQDDNLVMIHVHGEEFNYHNVRFMDTYDARYVNVKRDWVRVNRTLPESDATVSHYIRPND